MIRKLNNHGFKDQNRSLELTGLDLFTSADVNGVGKSAVLESFKLGLLGEIPGKAKTVEDILGFSSLPQITLQLDADTAEGPVAVKRGFLREAARGEKRPVWVNGIPRKFEEGDRWVRDTLGAVSISFDPFEFLSLSDARKRQWIISHSPESQRLNREGLRLVLLAGTMERFLGRGVVRPLLASRGLADVQNLLAQGEREGASLFEEFSRVFRSQDENLFNRVREGLDHALGHWSDSVSAEENLSVLAAHLKSEILRLKTAVRENTAALGCMDVSREKRASNLSAEISRCREEIRSLSQTMQELALAIEKENARAAAFEKKEERIRLLQQNIQSLVPGVVEDAADGLMDRIQQLREERVDTRQQEDGIAALEKQLAEKIRWIQEERVRHQAVAVDLQTRREKREGLNAADRRCPLAEAIRCDTDMKPYLDVLAGEIEKFTQREKVTRESLDRAETERRRLLSRIRECREALGRHTNSNARIEREIAGLERRFRAEEKKAAQKRGQLKAYREELEALQAEHSPTSGGENKAVDTKLLSRRKADLETLIHREEERLAGLLQEQGKTEAMRNLWRKKKEAEQQLGILQLISDLTGPRGLQGEIATRVAGGLEREVNELLKLIDEDLDFTLDWSGRKLEMGWNRKGTLIPFYTINSAHFVLFVVPFLTALINRLARVRERAGLPTLKALCIEAESLTPGNLALLLKGLSIMKRKGYLDNVLVAHYHSLRDPQKLCGFKEHILSEDSLQSTGPTFEPGEEEAMEPTFCWDAIVL